jgi:hypothetical protein
MIPSRTTGSPITGSFESWELGYDGKNPRKARLEEIVEISVRFRDGPQLCP